MEEKEEKSQWHIGKEIPITLIIAIFIQTLAAIWWAASFTAKIDNMINDMASLKADNYRKSDSIKDMAIIDYKIYDISRRLDKLEIKQTIER